MASRGLRDTVSVAFHNLVVAVFTTSGQLIVSPNSTLSARLAAIADDFSEYRFKSLEFRLHPDAIATQVCAVTYLPGIVDTPPATLADISQELCVAYQVLGMSIPSEWKRVPAGVLAGMHPWYKTVPGTPEASEEQQGVLCYFESSGGQSAEYIEIRGVCEFRGAVAAGNTPLDRALATRRREKARIMGLLAADTSSGAAPPPKK